MKAVRVTEPGPPEVLELVELPDPEPGPDDVLVDVRAAALNRADLMQRRGRYPAPAGAPEDIPGLEFAGQVAEVGDRVRGVAPGDRVMGLLGGGGYASRVVTPAGMVLPVPSGLDWIGAAAVPEVFFTAYDALYRQAGFSAGDRVMVHAAGGGVGSAALQLARVGGASLVVGTASAPKLEALEAAGLAPDVAVDRHEEDFAEVVGTETGGRGVDVILDMVGADYWAGNVASLSELGRIVVIGLLGGARVETDLGRLMRKRARVMGTVLRARSLSEKLALTDEVRERLLPLFADGRLRPVVDRTFPLAEAAEAHRTMEADRNVGKIVLEVPEA